MSANVSIDAGVYEQRQVLVTGGAGFIGRQLCKVLVAYGHRVRVIDIAPAAGPLPGCELVIGSVLDRVMLGRTIVGCDWVFHLAADPNLWARDPRSFETTNYDGTCAVLDAAASAGVSRFVHTSTESILKGSRRGHDARVDETVVRTIEDMPGAYCRSKFLAERAALDAARSGLPVVVVNPTLPVGPGDLRLTPPTRMLIDFLNGRSPAYLDFEMNLVDVRDVALGHLLAAQHARCGERYILGGENLHLHELLNMLGELTGLRMPRLRIPYPLALCVAALSELVADHLTHRAPRVTVAGVRVAAAGMHFDGAKARTELGFNPRPVRHALADAIAWMQHQRLLTRRPRHRAPRVAARCSDVGKPSDREQNGD